MTKISNNSFILNESIVNGFEIMLSGLESLKGKTFTPRDVLMWTSYIQHLHKIDLDYDGLNLLQINRWNKIVSRFDAISKFIHNDNN